MKKERLSFVLPICLITLHLSAQNLSFFRTFGGSHYDDARSVVALPDGGLVFTGLSQSGPDSLGAMFLTKTNAVGAVVWTKYFDREREDGGNHLLATRDGGFLISGHTALSYGSLCDGYLVKTGADGNETWRALVGGADDDVCNGAVELEDGSFVVTGRTEDAGSHTFRTLIARIGADGKQVFMKKMTGDQPSLAYKIAKSADGNLLLAGYNYFTDGRCDQFLVLKTDQEGNILWQFAIESPLGARAFQVVPLPDGGGIALGGTFGKAGIYEKICLARFDGSGRVMEQKMVGDLPETSCAFDCAQLADGSFVACGVAVSDIERRENPILLHFSASLEVLDFQKTGAENASARSLAVCPDGNIALAGFVKKEGSKADIFLGKMNGFSGNAALVDVEKMPFLLFPNPMGERAYLKVGRENEAKVLTLFTTDGHQICENRFESAEFFIEKKGLPSGTVLFNVKNSAGMTLKSGRLIVPD